ncbi:MarR family winged helix-turn-helix transcriptional regulator [Nocardia sp. Marseille-Q1738]
MDPHRLSDQPCFTVYSTANAIVRAYRPLLEPLGLTYPQYIVMMSLWEADQVDLRTLSVHTHLDAGTLTPIVKRLADKGFLERTRVSGDERRLCITVTAAGRELQRAAAHVPEAMLCQVGISPAEEKQLMRVCGRIQAALSP